MKPTLSFLLVTSSCLLVSCNRSSSPSPQTGSPLGRGVLASVDGQPIRVADFKAELERRSRGLGDAYARPERREALLKEMIDSEALYLRAKAAGFDQKPEIARLINQLVANRYLETQLAGSVEKPIVTEAEVGAYYENHNDRFATPEQVRFAVIEFRFSSKATDEKKGEVIQKANQVLNEARMLPVSERAFGLLAQRYSEDQATRYARGDAGWESRNGATRWLPDVVDAAFALKQPGDLGPVITVSNGCYLVKLIEKKDEGRRPLEEVKDAIRYELAQGKRQRSQQEFYDSMKAGLKIEINQPLLESIEAPAVQSEAKPPHTPAG
jgi:parvulin-like peptidyl-prolyl isomerase